MKTTGLLLITLFFSTPGYSKDYPATGSFANTNAMFACADAQSKALDLALSENSALEIRDLSYPSQARFTSNGYTECRTRLSLDSKFENFHPNRLKFRDKDRRKFTLKGNDATAEAACAEAERLLLHWSQYSASTTDHEQDRPYGSRLISRNYETGKEWGTGIPIASCEVSREFFYVIVSRPGYATRSITASNPNEACAKAESTLKELAANDCEKSGLGFEYFSLGTRSISETREGSPVCELSASWVCFSE